MQRAWRCPAPVSIFMTECTQPCCTTRISLIEKMRKLKADFVIGEDELDVEAEWRCGGNVAACADAEQLATSKIHVTSTSGTCDEDAQE